MNDKNCQLFDLIKFFNTKTDNINSINLNIHIYQINTI